MEHTMTGSRIAFRLGLLSAAVALFTPPAAYAQAICSAPHSSPSLSQSGSIKTLPPGAGWLQVSVYRQQADESFNHLGNRQPFLANGQFDTRSIFLTGAVGLTRGLELWAQLPVHNLSADAAGDNSTTTGVGDIRFAGRIGSEFFGLNVPLALRAGVKVPGSEFPVDATVLPLTEGQLDFETSLESGGKLGSLPLYVTGWVGYRWRTENQEAARTPGDEAYAHAALGALTGDFLFEVAADGLWGRAPLAQGILLVGERRRLIQLIPTVGYRAGPGRLEFTSQIPVYGRNLPSGIGMTIGYRFAWGI
jgi:hypothetical protein